MKAYFAHLPRCPGCGSKMFASGPPVNGVAVVFCIAPECPIKDARFTYNLPSTELKPETQETPEYEETA